MVVVVVVVVWVVETLPLVDLVRLALALGVLLTKGKTRPFELRQGLGGEGTPRSGVVERKTEVVAALLGATDKPSQARLSYGSRSLPTRPRA